MGYGAPSASFALEATLCHREWLLHRKCDKPQGLWALLTWLPLGWVIPCCRGCLVQCRVFNSTLPTASVAPPLLPVVRAKNVSRYY